jgi:hypothetical protein
MDYFSLLVSRFVVTWYSYSVKYSMQNIFLTWSRSLYIAGLRASNVGALSEDVDKSIDSAFPAHADGGLVVVRSQSERLSKNLKMLTVSR